MALRSLSRRIPAFQTGRRSFWSTQPVLGGGAVSYRHKDTPYNHDETPFDFNAENTEQVKKIMAKYPPHYKKACVIPLLHLAQKQQGWLPLAAMNKVATILQVPKVDVYETATFYTMFNREPVGKYFVQVCGTTPCQLCGANEVIAALQSHLKISMGETTPDKKFTLVEVECLGACVNAPMMQINDDYYEDLTPEIAVGIMESLAKDVVPPYGPQQGRKVSMPRGGKTTLLEPPPGPGDFVRADL
mmetsp:Transcript_31946/g.80114  ORF Transcript_31946/g.80114 Transcript_31946/m.80114 type:complete len:245 (+) Transcript_31946:49-783(+)